MAFHYKISKYQCIQIAQWWANNAVDTATSTKGQWNNSQAFVMVLAEKLRNHFNNTPAVTGIISNDEPHTNFSTPYILFKNPASHSSGKVYGNFPNTILEEARTDVSGPSSVKFPDATMLVTPGITHVYDLSAGRAQELILNSPELGDPIKKSICLEQFLPAATTQTPQICLLHASKKQNNKFFSGIRASRLFPPTGERILATGPWYVYEIEDTGIVERELTSKGTHLYIGRKGDLILCNVYDPATKLLLTRDIKKELGLVLHTCKLGTNRETLYTENSIEVFRDKPEISATKTANASDKLTILDEQYRQAALWWAERVPWDHTGRFNATYLQGEIVNALTASFKAATPQAQNDTQADREYYPYRDQNLDRYYVPYFRIGSRLGTSVPPAVLEGLDNKRLKLREKNEKLLPLATMTFLSGITIVSQTSAPGGTFILSPPHQTTHYKMLQDFAEEMHDPKSYRYRAQYSNAERYVRLETSARADEICKSHIPEGHRSGPWLQLDIPKGNVVIQKLDTEIIIGHAGDTVLIDPKNHHHNLLITKKMKIDKGYKFIPCNREGEKLPEKEYKPIANPTAGINRL